MKAFHLLPAEFAVSNIAFGRMKVSRYEDLNDPFELLAWNTQDRSFRQSLAENKAEFQKKYGLISFSKTWHNPLLWSHYADKHRGIAMGFEIDDSFVGEITYSNDRLENEPARESSLRTKFLDWQYEDEVRIGLDLKECEYEGGLHFLPFSNEIKLVEIVIGAECSITVERFRKLIGSLCPEVKVIKARLAFQSFKVVENMKYEI